MQQKSLAVTLVRWEGPIDFKTRDEARDQVQAAMRGTSRDVLVDLTRVTLMDSDGLAILLAAHQRLESQNRRLVVVSRDPRVQKFIRRLTEKSSIPGLPPPYRGKISQILAVPSSDPETTFRPSGEKTTVEISLG